MGKILSTHTCPIHFINKGLLFLLVERNGGKENHLVCARVF